MKSLKPEDLIKDLNNIIDRSIYSTLLILYLPQTISNCSLALTLKEPNWILPVSIYFLITYLLSRGAIIFYTYQRIKGKRTTLFKAYQYSTKSLPKLGLASILYLLIIALGFVLLIVPGIYLFYLLTFFNKIIILEGCSVVDALKRSRQLVKGNWWKVFWIFNWWKVFWILLSIYFAINSVDLLIFSGNFYLYILAIVVDFFATPYLVAYSTLVYATLVDLKLDLKVNDKIG